jgi:hypothetical protein
MMMRLTSIIQNAKTTKSWGRQLGQVKKGVFMVVKMMKKKYKMSHKCSWGSRAGQARKNGGIL